MHVRYTASHQTQWQSPYKNTTWSRATSREWIYAWAPARASKIADRCTNTAATMASFREAFLGKRFVCYALTIVYSIYNTVGRSIASIYDLGGIFTSALCASVNMSPRVVYIGYGPTYRTIYITYCIYHHFTGGIFLIYTTELHLASAQGGFLCNILPLPRRAALLHFRSQAGNKGVFT